MIECCEVLDESDCDDDGDEDDIYDGNDDNLLKEIREDDKDDDIDKDSNENQEEGESVQEENNFRNLLQTTRYGRTCRTWRGRAILGDPGAVSRVDKMFVVKVFCPIEARLDLTENFDHEHFIDPTSCPWVSEDGVGQELRTFLEQRQISSCYLQVLVINMHNLFTVQVE